MLETIRRHQRSFLIYLIFGGLIAVFAINFGPQAGNPGAGGCATKDAWVARVSTHSVGEPTWRFALLGITGGSASGARARAQGMRERVMNLLLTREVLATEAEARGFRVSHDEAEAHIARGEIFLAGIPLDAKQQGYFNKDGAFDYELLEQFVRGRGLSSVPAFVEEQQRELLAHRLRELIRGSARVSPEEVLAEYTRENTKVWAEYVKFEPYKYARDLELSAADLEAFVASRDADLKTTYESRKSAFTGLPKQVRLRQMFFKSETSLGADAAPGAIAVPDEAARGKATAALARVKTGEDFARVARDVSSDKRAASPLWRSLTSLGAAELKAAVEGLGAGAVSEVIETPQGFYVVKVEGVREGDQGFDQVKGDLAEELLREERARELAKKDAEDALAKAKAGVGLDVQFQKVSTDTSPDGERHGWRDVDGDWYVPAELAEDVAQAGASPAPVPAAPAPPPQPVAAKPVAPVSVPAPTKPIAATAIVPAAGSPERPKLLEATALVRAGSKLTGIGESAALTKALFEGLEPGALASEVFEVKAYGDKADYVVVRLVKREEPDMKKFEEEKAELASGLALVKGYRLVEELADRSCRESRDRGELVVNPLYVDYGEVDPKTGKPLRTAYTPCEDPQPLGLPPGLTLGQ